MKYLRRRQARLRPWKGPLNRRGKINSPTFAYQTVYGKNPPAFLPGRSGAPTKMWRGLDVDKSLKNKWLHQLNALPVEVRSTEAGKGPDRPAFTVLRMPVGQDKMHKELVQQLKKHPDLYVRSDVGMGGRPRICVAGKLWEGQEGWKNWWDTLPGKIRQSYQNVGSVKKVAFTSAFLDELEKEASVKGLFKRGSMKPRLRGASEQARQMTKQYGPGVVGGAGVGLTAKILIDRYTKKDKKKKKGQEKKAFFLGFVSELEKLQ